MKKISRFAALFVLLASFSTPLFASAQSLPAGMGCPDGANWITADGRCEYGDGSTATPVSVNSIPPGTILSPASGSGVNLTIAQGYSTGIINLINSILVPVLMAIAFIVFLWGVYKYFIYGADNETERATGKQFVLWGIIGFVVILSVWGLVAIVSGTLGLQLGGAAPKPPTI